MKKKLTYIAVTTLIIFAWYLFDNGKSINNIDKDNTIMGNNINKNTALNVDKIIGKSIGLPTTKIKKRIDNHNRIKETSNNKLDVNNGFEGELINIPMPENILKNAIQELESDEFQKDLLIDIGFDKEGSEKILTEDPKNPLSATNLPKDIQESIQNMLKDRKKNGYDKTSDKNTHEITGVMNYIVSTSKSIPNIRFPLSNIPTIVGTNYNYIGYTFSGVFDTQAVEGTYGSVRRVYNSSDSSHILIIEESANNKHAGAYLIKDFVNTVVNEYPAIYSIKKSPNGKHFALLNWIIPSYTYDLYFVGILRYYVAATPKSKFKPVSI